MKENREVTDTNVEDIEEALEKLSTGKKIKLYELLRTFKREGIENFVTTRKKYVDVILSDYKRVLKENNRLEEQVEYDKTHIYTPQTIELNFISKSKIKDKIEELKKEGDYRTADNPYGRIHFMEEPCDYKIQVLKELLESEDSKDGENKKSTNTIRNSRT